MGDQRLKSPSPYAPHLRGAPPATFRGHCGACGREHRLDHDVPLALSALGELFRQLDEDPAFAEVRAALEASRGKMVGVLVAESRGGARSVLRAYSGELAGRRDWPDWVAPVLRRSDTAELERVTLARIAALDAQIATCDAEGAQRRLDEAREGVRLAAAARKEVLRAAQSGSPAAREEAKRVHREAVAADARRVSDARDALLAERERLRALRVARRSASQLLSTAMFDAATVTTARGERRHLREIFGERGIAGGTTDCTVPKLLEAANVAGLRPIALAEAWWGPTLNGRHHGDLQDPCERKCLPVMGALLCGLEG